jgi:hypothetical protein
VVEKLATHTLRKVHQRLKRLRNQGLEPIEAIMTADTWDALQAEHRAATPGMLGRLAGRDVLGIRIKLQPACRGVVIKYFGGMDFDQAD